MLKQSLLAVAIAVAPMTAFAAGSLDVFYVDQDIDIKGAGEDDGDGVGFRGLAELGKGVSLTALYQDADLDAADANLRETRIGLRYDTTCHNIKVGGSLENVSIDLNNGGVGLSMRGYSATAHASINLIDNLSLTARAGYTDVEELAGMEYEVGAHYAINKQVSAFVEYRMANLDDEGLGADVDLDTLRVGGRYNF
ncbi:MAG: porin [Pseudomonadota bacterium]